MALVPCSEIVLFSGTTASAPGTVAQTPVAGFAAVSGMTLVATIAGPTGGTLDVYVQDSADGITYYDFAHFATAGIAAPAVTYRYPAALNDNITIIGSGATPALAAGSVAGGHWFEFMRVLVVSGAGVSVGAALTVKALAVAGR